MMTFQEDPVCTPGVGVYRITLVQRRLSVNITTMVTILAFSDLSPLLRRGVFP